MTKRACPTNCESVSSGTLCLADLHSLPATLGVVEAGRLLGIGRTTAYELVHEGKFPAPVVRCGRRFLVPTMPLLELLGIRYSPALESRA